MNKIHSLLSSNELADFLDAIKSIQDKVQWKYGKDVAHLKKRQRMGHISMSASLMEYEEIIQNIVNSKRNVAYLYEYNETDYYAVRGFFQSKEWIVIFGSGGIMETAFPP
ncbi:MAG: hypothetical protein R6U55_00175 [Desulfovermiculus sp.]